MRNSSLVEGFRAENVTGLKSAAEAVDVREKVEKIREWATVLRSSMPILLHGRGAFLGHRSSDVSRGGARGSENPGMSSVKIGENPIRRKPKVSYATLFGVGLVGPKL